MFFFVLAAHHINRCVNAIFRRAWGDASKRRHFRNRKEVRHILAMTCYSVQALSTFSHLTESHLRGDVMVGTQELEK